MTNLSQPPQAAEHIMKYSTPTKILSNIYRLLSIIDNNIHLLAA